MDLLTPADLQKLSEEQKEICVSLIMPGEILVGGNLNNRTRFRNLVEKSKKILSETSLNKDKVEKFLAPAIDILNDDSFWQDQFTSLFVYLYSDGAITYKLPIEVSETVYVSHYFYILPLLGYFSGNVNFFLLSLDDGGTKFFEGDKYYLKDITTEAIRNVNLENLMENYEIEEEQLYHVENKGARSKKHEDVMYYGHGNAKDDKKIREKRLLEIIEAEVTKSLDGQISPLLLAGHQHLVSIYRKINKYHYLLPAALKIKSEYSDNKEIHEEALKIIKTVGINRLMDAKKSYCDLIGTGFTSADIEEVLRGIGEGRASDVFIEEDNYPFGSFVLENDKIQVTETNDVTDENLANLAAIFAIKTGTKIHFAEKKFMPERGISATFRY